MSEKNCASRAAIYATRFQEILDLLVESSQSTTATGQRLNNLMYNKFLERDFDCVQALEIEFLSSLGVEGNDTGVGFLDKLINASERMMNGKRSSMANTLQEPLRRFIEWLRTVEVEEEEAPIDEGASPVADPLTECDRNNHETDANGNPLFVVGPISYEKLAPNETFKMSDGYCYSSSELKDLGEHHIGTSPMTRDDWTTADLATIKHQQRLAAKTGRSGGKRRTKKRRTSKKKKTTKKTPSNRRR